jgi:hypothetical protein
MKSTLPQDPKQMVDVFQKRRINNKQQVIQYVQYMPEDAEAILEQNLGDNRPIRPSKVKKYAADMEAALWNPYNGTAVQFDEEGKLIDGHHRFLAIALYGGPVILGTLFNQEREAQATIDNNANRTLTDFLVLNKGERKAAPIIKAIVGLDVLHSGRGMNLHSLEAAEPHITERTLQEYAFKPEVMEAVQFGILMTDRTANREATVPFLSRAHVGGLYYLASQYDDVDRGIEFFDTWANPAHLNNTDPIRLARARFSAAKDRATKQSVLTRNESWKLLIQTYNQHFAGERRQRAVIYSAFPRLKNFSNEEEIHTNILGYGKNLGR